MNIIPLDESRREAARQFLNGIFAADSLVYSPLEEEAFAAGFMPQEGSERHVTLLWEDASEIVGLASGVVMESGKRYLTFAAVKPALRRQGLGTRLLNALEEKLTEGAEPPVKLECVFFNPVNLTWVVPGTPGHDHPNAPGVDVSIGGYLFLKNRGYRDWVQQNSYYLPLAKYEYPEALAKKKEALAEEGIEITVYDPAKHTGLEELMDALGSEDWKMHVMTNAARPDGGDPLLVVVSDGRCVGFTGPMAVQPSGRGYFAGIGIHPDFRGRGAGKVLFGALCLGLKGLGAGYMTLFTGETNPARNIYEAAGFKIVKTWADMRKEF